MVSDKNCSSLSPKSGFAAHFQATRTALSGECPYGDQTYGVVSLFPISPSSSTTPDWRTPGGVLSLCCHSTGLPWSRKALCQVCAIKWPVLILLPAAGVTAPWFSASSPSQQGGFVHGKDSACHASYWALPQGSCDTALPGLRQTRARGSSNVLIG